MELSEIAKKYDWEEIPTKDPYMRSFVKREMRINYWECTGTIGTYLLHPKQGKTQLFRKFIYGKELEKVFKNPRHHIGRGYR